MKNSKIILVTGGGRSGKSVYAQRMAEALPAPRVFLATCPVIDAEMEDRIRKHQAMRAQADWKTVEEPVDLVRAVGQLSSDTVILVDCLTLWINNLMFEAEKKGEVLTEPDVARQCESLTQLIRTRGGTVIFVTNEVGMGIIPENPLCRAYRDLAGRANQVIAEAADQVVLMVCGQPLRIK